MRVKGAPRPWLDPEETHHSQVTGTEVLRKLTIEQRLDPDAGEVSEIPDRQRPRSTYKEDLNYASASFSEMMGQNICLHLKEQNR